MKEEIVPKKPSKRKIAAAIGRAAICGAVFGVVAAACFFTVGSLIEGNRRQSANAAIKLPVSSESIADESISEADTIELASEESSSIAVEEASASSASVVSETDEAEQSAEPVQEVIVMPQETKIVEKRIFGEVSDLASIYRKLSDTAEETELAIVEVTSVVDGEDWFENPYEAQKSTCGFVLAITDESLYVFTDYATVEDASNIRLSFAQGLAMDAELLSADRELDFAILEASLENVTVGQKEKLVSAKLGSSVRMTRGVPVMGLGNPTGAMYSMVTGFVTGTDLDLYVTDDDIDMFTTDMSAASGFVVDTDGRIVGIISKKRGGVIGITEVRERLELMLNGVGVPYTGIHGENLNAASAAKIGYSGGLYITEVDEGSPADEAGIDVGDVLLMIGETEITNFRQYAAILMDKTAGQEMTVTIYRMQRDGGEEAEVTVVVGSKK